MLAPWKKSYDQPRQHIKKQRCYFANKGPSSEGYGFSSSHVWMWELDHKENWVLKNWCFWAVVLEKTLSSCTRNWTHVPCIARQTLNQWTTREVPSTTFQMYHRPCLSLVHPHSLTTEIFTVDLHPSADAICCGQSWWPKLLFPSWNLQRTGKDDIQQIIWTHYRECNVVQGTVQVQFSHSVVSDFLQPHGLQHARPPCLSPTPGACSNSCPSS